MKTRPSSGRRTPIFERRNHQRIDLMNKTLECLEVEDDLARTHLPSNCNVGGFSDDLPVVGRPRAVSMIFNETTLGRQGQGVGRTDARPGIPVFVPALPAQLVRPTEGLGRAIAQPFWLAYLPLGRSVCRRDDLGLVGRSTDRGVEASPRRPHRLRSGRPWTDARTRPSGGALVRVVPNRPRR
jgi:hypothetical protein